MNYTAEVKGLDVWPELFEAYRIDVLRGGELISGRLLPGLDPQSEPVRDALARWEGSYEARRGPAGWELLLYRPLERKERWVLHVGLLLLTLFSTMVAGSLLRGHHPIGYWFLPLGGEFWLPIPASVNPDRLAAGLPFGLSLVVILFLHETGHYVAARYHRVGASPPYFIPVPPYLSIIGTLGAFIRLRSPLLNRRQLLDIGVAGPLASFVASIPILWWGLAHSRVVSTASGAPGLYLVRFLNQEIWLGGSPIFTGLVKLLLDFGGEGQVLWLHPVAFAGWIGLFVTALNLLPISQLDGGHILYAMVGRRQKTMAWVFFLALLPLGFLWAGWWLWALLVFVVGRGRVGHPPVFNGEKELTPGRVAVGAVAAAAFLLCFVAVPFRL